MTVPEKQCIDFGNQKGKSEGNSTSRKFLNPGCPENKSGMCVSLEGNKA